MTTLGLPHGRPKWFPIVAGQYPQALCMHNWHPYESLLWKIIATFSHSLDPYCRTSWNHDREMRRAQRRQHAFNSAAHHSPTWPCKVVSFSVSVFPDATRSSSAWRRRRETPETINASQIVILSANHWRRSWYWQLRFCGIKIITIMQILGKDVPMVGCCESHQASMCMMSWSGFLKCMACEHAVQWKRRQALNSSTDKSPFCFQEKLLANKSPFS